MFPQVAGLGASPRTLHFAIASRAEALAYLAHEALGPRLREAVRLMLAVENQNALDVLGTPDDLKFRSSMTLFDAVAPNDIFAAALKKYFNGEGDARTVLNLAESQL